MTISTAYAPSSYNGDGVTSVFAVTFPYQLSTDLIVQQQNVMTGVVTTLALGTNYTVTPSVNSPAATGSVTLLGGALAVGQSLLISIAIPRTQLTHWLPNDPNPSIAIENAVDKLTLMFQQTMYGFGRTWYLRPFDTDGSGMFDARGNRGGNAGDPVNAQDLVTLNYMTNYVNSLVTSGFVTSPLDYEYTGDGGTTSFGIPGATVPQATGYYVMLDGLVQRPVSDYTITLGANPIITFALPPPANVLVSIRVLGYSKPILTGIDGSLINSGRVLPQFLGLGANTVSTFLRGDGNWSNTIIGARGVPSGTITPNASIIFDLQNHGISGMRLLTDSATSGGAGHASLVFGVAGTGRSFEAAFEYYDFDKTLNISSGITSTLTPAKFYAQTGNVAFGAANNTFFMDYANSRIGINNGVPLYALDVFGTVNASNYIGNAAGSLITSGQVLPQFLASNTPSNSLFLRGDGIWAIPPGGGGGGGPTTIQISDAATASSTAGTLNFTGQTANASGVTVPIYIQSLSAQVASIRAYVPGSGANKPGVMTSTTATDTAWTVSSTVGGVLQDTDGLSRPSFGKIGTANLNTTGVADSNHYLNGAMAWAQIVPTGLRTINSPSNGLVLAYDSGSGFFNWVSNSTLPSGGTTGTFLRGDGNWAFELDVSQNSGGELIVASGLSVGSFGLEIAPIPSSSLMFFSGAVKTNTGWAAIPTGKVWNYQFGTEPAVLSVSASWTSIDSTAVESMYLPGWSRTAAGARSLIGMWQQTVTTNAPGASITIDVNNGSYQRLTGFANNVSITLADSTPLPSNSVYRYAGHLTLELNSLGSFDITWPATITWAGNASAPTVANGALSSSGINIVKLIRRQGQTQWVGYLDNVSAAGGGSYTDNQARQALFGTGSTSTALPNTSTIAWTFSGTPANQVGAAAVVAGSIGNTQLASGIAISKLTGYPTDATKFLRGDGTWAVPSGGGGGQSVIQFQNQSGNIGVGTMSTVNFTGAGVTATASGTTVNVSVPGGIAGLSGTNNGTAVSGGPFTTLNAPSGSNITLSSPSSGILNIVASGGGTFSPATSYTWTAGQAFNAANTYGATGLYTVSLPSPYSGTVTVGTGGLGDAALGGVAGQYIHVLNNSDSAHSGITQTATFWQTLKNPGGGINAVESILDIQGNCTSAGFHLGFTQATSVRQLNKTGNSGTVDAVWLVAASPNTNYSATPDPAGIINTFTAGTVRIGEVNYGNGWADFGLVEKLGVAARIVSGLEFYPDYIPPSAGSVTPIHKFDTQWAICIGGAVADTFGHTPQNHIGMLINQNGISPGGYALRLWGSVGSLNGNTEAQNAPSAIIKMSGSSSTGIDFAGTANDSTPLTATATGAPVMILADATQSIQLGSIWLRGNAGALQYSTNGTTWSNVTLP